MNKLTYEEHRMLLRKFIAWQKEKEYIDYLTISYEMAEYYLETLNLTE